MPRPNITEKQDEFLASNMYSLAQSYVALLNDKPPPMPYAICADDRVIGFVMMFHEIFQGAKLLPDWLCSRVVVVV